MLLDLRYAFRQLAKNPSFTAAVVLVLGLGIGANTAIFSAIDSVLLSALPVAKPEQLVFLTNPDSHRIFFGYAIGNREYLTYSEFTYLRDHADVFSGVLANGASASRAEIAFESTGQSQPFERATVSLVSGSYFGVLGLQPTLGRFFGTEVDGRKNAAPYAVVSYRYWRTRLGGDPSTIGRRVRINQTTYEIVGVGPEGFDGETNGVPVALWVPVTMQPVFNPGNDWLVTEPSPQNKIMWLQAIGRLKPGVSPARAQAEIDVLFRQYLDSRVSAVPQMDRPVYLNQRVVLTEGRRGASVLRDPYRQPLFLLMALVGLLLAIACLNVANLLLARAAARAKETAIRLAIGAGLGRIFRQFLVESLLLSVLGGIAGLLLARWGDALLLRLFGLGVELHFHASVFSFTLAVTLVVGTLFGLAPVLQARRRDASGVLSGSGEASRRGWFSLGRLLIVGQVTVSLLLVVVAGMFLRSLRNLAAADVGYVRSHLLQVNVFPGRAGYKPTEWPALFQKLTDALAGLPGVQAVTFSEDGLLLYAYNEYSVTAVAGSTDPATFSECYTDQVGPRYFPTIGLPLIAGRALEAQDDKGEDRATVINRTMARRLFGDANPLGRGFHFRFDGAWHHLHVVGVVADAAYDSPKDTVLPRFYAPYWNPISNIVAARFEVRTANDPARLLLAVPPTVHKVAPELKQLGVQTLDSIADRSLTLDRALAKLSGFFGAAAALLAAVGICGVISYSVVRRTREIGIRMAIGAQRSDVLWLVLGEALVLAAIGVGLSLPAGFAAKRLLGDLLFRISPLDPVVLGGAALGMLVCALAAALLPAWRASRVDPLIALRTD